MKKRILSLALVFLTLLFSSCNKEKEKETGDPFTPLLRFVVEEGSENQLRLFTMPESRGYFYLHPSAQGGFSGGFVSLARSISSESVVNETVPLDFAFMREAGEDRATLISSAGISNLLLKENFSETMPLPEGISLKDGIYYDELTLIGETEELLLLCPVDLSQTYVLAKKADLPSFARPLLVTHEGERIWYALKGEEEGSYGGFAYFEKGKKEALGVEKFPFDDFVPVGNTGVIFIRHLEDGGALYLFRSLGRSVGGSFTADEPFDAVACDEAGKVLVGIYSGDGEGSVVICDLATGKEKSRYVPPEASPAPVIAVSRDGTEALIALSGGGEEVLGILSLS